MKKHYNKTKDKNYKKSNFKLKILIIFISILVMDVLFIIIPLIINGLYESDYVLVYTDWGAKEVLSFYGSVLTFLGTTSLGIITVKLSKEANKTNNEMKEFQEKKDKEKLIDLYYQYIESIGLIYDLYYVLGDNFQKSEMQIYATIKQCYSKAEMIRKRLIILDFVNSDNSFFAYTKEKIEDLLLFRNVEDTHSDDFLQKYQDYCIAQSKDFEEKSAEFICDIYNSIFKEDTHNANT